MSSGQVLVSECRLGGESRDDVHMCSDFGRGLGLETHCDERCQVVGRTPKIGTLASGSGWSMSVRRFLGGPGPWRLSRRGGVGVGRFSEIGTGPTVRCACAPILGLVGTFGPSEASCVQWASVGQRVPLGW